MHKFVKEFDFDNVMSEKRYGLFETYAQSKLANMLFAFALQRRYASNAVATSSCLYNDSGLSTRLFAKGSKVTCNAVHPGIVTTEVTRHMHVVMRKLEHMFSFFLSWVRKTPAEGAYTTVYAATAAEINGKGRSADYAIFQFVSVSC
jgi:NAD(P)-dependent dehydrogenase (short-subunit alcohol dehydrogenase family)